MYYYFLYKIQDGRIEESPYLGNAEEWTNIPEGCGVIGPLSPNETIKDAFKNPQWYTVLNDELTPLPNIEELRAQRKTDNAKPQPKTPEQKTIDKLTSDNEQMNLQIIDLFEQLVTKGVL